MALQSPVKDAVTLSGAAWLLDAFVVAIAAVYLVRKLLRGRHLFTATAAILLVAAAVFALSRSIPFERLLAHAVTLVVG